MSTAGQPDRIGTRYPEIWNSLSEEFHPDLVKSRPQGGRNLRYITARTAMNRLDKVMGFENWWDDYIPGENSVLCRLTIRLPDGTTLTKADAGGYAGMSDQGDDDKSGYSDAFKRAAVKFGIGRYLYGEGVFAAKRDRSPRTEKATPAEPPGNDEAPQPAAAPPKAPPKFQSNDSGHGRTGSYGSPEQVAALMADVSEQYGNTKDKWIENWMSANREMPPGLPEHPIPKPMLMNHLLKQAVKEGKLKELPDTFDPETGKRIAKVSIEQTKQLVAVVHNRDRNWIRDEIWLYFWEKSAEVSRAFFDDNPNWTVPTAFDIPAEEQEEAHGDAYEGDDLGIDSPDPAMAGKDGA